MSERFYGCHVSSAGGLENALENGDRLGVNTIQIHSAPPQRWNTKMAAPGEENEFLERFGHGSVKQVFFHGIYLINLATAESKNLKLSILSLQNSLDLLQRIKARGLIFHVGSLKELEQSVGFKQAAAAIDEALHNVPGDGRLLLEVSAGSGTIVGAKIEELRAIFDLVKNQDRIGFALDTQHMWASGYNWQEDLEEILSQIEKHYGFDRIGAIHLNDSMTECASRKDRHANLGEGLIGEAALKAVFNHPKLAHIPFILETPAMKNLEEAKLEVEKLKGWLAT
jgi:deoxyribonuclease-4